MKPTLRLHLEGRSHRRRGVVRQLLTNVLARMLKKFREGFRGPFFQLEQFLPSRSITAKFPYKRDLAHERQRLRSTPASDPHQRAATSLSYCRGCSKRKDGEVFETS